jgi:hypothetical protein
MDEGEGDDDGDSEGDQESRMGVGGRDLDAELEDMEEDVRNTTVTVATEDSDFDEMEEIEPLAGELDE